MAALTAEERQELAELEELERLEAKYSGTDLDVPGAGYRADAPPATTTEPLSIGESLARPFTRAAEVYQEEAAGGREQLGEPGALNKAIGALRYGAAPLTAVGRGFVGEPVEAAGEAAGMSPKAAGYLGTAAEFATPGIGLTRLPGHAARAAAKIPAIRGKALAKIFEGSEIEGAATSRADLFVEAETAAGKLPATPTTSTRKRRIAAGQKLGYKPTTGELTGNKRLLAWEDAIENMAGGTAYEPMRLGNKRTTNKLLSGRVGDETAEIDDQWFAKTSDDIGKQFEAVRAFDKAPDIPNGAPKISLTDALAKFEQGAEAAGISGESTLGSAVRRFKKKYGDAMTWDQYVTQRGEWARSAVGKTDRDMARRLGEFVGILDDAAIQAAPEGGQGLKEASRKYREMLMIRDAVDASGNVVAGNLRRGIENLKGSAFHTAAPGEDELVDAARYLEITQSLRSSGTAERAQAIAEIKSLKSVQGLGSAGLDAARVAGAKRLIQGDPLKRALTETSPGAEGAERAAPYIQKGLAARPLLFPPGEGEATRFSEEDQNTIPSPRSEALGNLDEEGPRRPPSTIGNKAAQRANFLSQATDIKAREKKREAMEGVEARV